MIVTEVLSFVLLESSSSIPIPIPFPCPQQPTANHCNQYQYLILNIPIYREYDIDIDEAWQVAAEKVERRTPYMKEWSDGTSMANNSQEAEAIWQAVKKKEKAEKMAASTKLAGDGFDTAIDGDNVNCARRDSLRCWKLNNGIVWSQLKRHGCLFGGASLGLGGFALGVVFANKFMIGRPR